MAYTVTFHDDGYTESYRIQMYEEANMFIYTA